MILLLAAAAALPFAPPVDRPLHYRVTERRPLPDGGVRGATLEEEVRFVVEPGGYAMTIRTTGYRDEGPSDPAFAAAMKPMVGTAVRVHLSPGGVPERVIDGAASWAAMLAGLRAQTAAERADDPARVAAVRMLAMLEATPPAERDARLLAAADDILATRLPPLGIGERAARQDGSVTREADASGDWRYRETTRQAVPGDPARTIDSVGEVTIARATGLVAHSLRRAHIGTTLVSESETQMVAGPSR